MMRDRSFGEPIEYVIWLAWSLLALVLGLGGAFFLWAALRHAEQGVVAAAVCALGFGLSLIGIALDRPLARYALALFSVALVLFYLVGPAEFSRLL